MSSVLSAAGLTKWFRQGDETIDVLRGVDLELRAGEFTDVDVTLSR